MRQYFASLLSIAVLTPAAMAAVETPASTSSTDAQRQLLEEVKQLRSEVNELKAERARDRALPAARPADAVTASQYHAIEAATDSAVQADAARHSTLLGDMGGLTAGYARDQFVIRSEDGNFLLHPWVHFQGRYVVNDRQDFKSNGSDETDSGFEVRRLRFGLDGNLFTPNLTYFFNWSTVRASGTSTVTDNGQTVGTVSNNLGGTPLLEEGWVRFKLPGTDFSLKGGQIKDVILHDQIVSSRYQQSTERSLSADIFANGDAFTEGAILAYEPATALHAALGVNHGLRSANTNFLDYPNSNAYDFGVTGRLEYKAFGNWIDYQQIGGQKTKRPLLVFGLGGDLSERGHANQTVAAADVMYVHPGGLNLYGAFVDRYTDHNFGIATQSPTGASITAAPPGVANTATNEFSLLGEAGYLIANHWEPFGRFEYLHLAGTAAGSHTYIPAIFGGLNYYFVGHRAKLTAQGVYLPVGIPIDDTPNDILASPNGRGEFVFVTQFQLLL